MESPVMRAARALTTAGVSVIPIEPDGTKAPPQGWRWKPYQSRVMDPQEIEMHFAGSVGIAAICGPVSGNLECLDFDDMTLYEPWAYAVENAVPGLFERLVSVATPDHGMHLWYRHDDAPERNRKLALNVKPDGQPGIQIETRGEGGYAIIPPSPPSVHPSDRPYRLIRGTLRAIPTITADERAVLLDAARALGSYVPASRHDQQQARTRGNLAPGDRPGDAFNAQADWSHILERHGWHAAYTRGERTAWRRPGKERGISATTNHGGCGLLYVFSSNAAPFEPDTSYSPFAAYTLLEHAGDFHAAAQALAAQGYGLPSEDGRERPDNPRPPAYVGAWRRSVARGRLADPAGAA